MTAFFAIFVMAMTITAVVDYTKMIVKDKKIAWENLLAIVLGILTAWAYQLNLFDVLGIKAAVPFISYLLTGILISRGSNWLYDFIAPALKYKTEPPAEK